MAGYEAVGEDRDRTVRPAHEAQAQARRVAAEAPPPGGDVNLRAPPADLTILLDLIDAMPADMLADCRDESPPQERDGL
jgi:hypothetical protein